MAKYNQLTKADFEHFLKSMQVNMQKDPQAPVVYAGKKFWRDVDIALVEKFKAEYSKLMPSLQKTDSADANVSRGTHIYLSTRHEGH